MKKNIFHASPYMERAKEILSKMTLAEKIGQTVLYGSMSQLNMDDMKAKMEALTAKFNEVSTKLYQQAGANAQQNQGGFDPNAGYNPGADAGASYGTGADTGSAKNDDNVVDADYTVVDEDK